jgi:gliding motility-associated lipoprotein GldH
MCRSAQMHSNGENTPSDYPIVEVRFKNTRKGYYRIQDDPTQYTQGDIVAVEGDRGYEVGLISLQGDAVRMRMSHIGIDESSDKVKKLLRKAKQPDIDKWIETIRIEKETQRKARVIAIELGLEMKINSVEYQGDRTKAIFYYTAEGRVDFRQLIKRYAEEFRVRIEMKQIGIRQEASIIGGIGPCGREFCCVSFKRQFNSVSTGAAKVQQLSLNPQKLAGQCGKLKCCLNYEAEIYEEALTTLPDSRIPVETVNGTANCVKIDIFKRIFTYVYENKQNDFINVPAADVAVYLEMNRQGKKAPDLKGHAQRIEKETVVDVASQDDLNRFDKPQRHNRQNENDRQDRPHPHSRTQQIGKPQRRPAQEKQPANHINKPKINNSNNRPQHDVPAQEKQSHQTYNKSKPTLKPLSKPILKSIFILCCLVSVMACNNNTILDKMYETPKPSWTSKQIIPFEATITDTTAFYDVYFSLRNTTDYPYSNAFFLINTKFPTNEKYTDTIECVLADPTGKWLGSGLGRYRTRVFLMKNRIKFPLAGTYNFGVKHAMRTDSLKEISEVGMRIVKLD